MVQSGAPDCRQLLYLFIRGKPVRTEGLKTLSPFNLYYSSTLCLGKGMEGLRVPASAHQVRATLPFIHSLSETYCGVT